MVLSTTKKTSSMSSIVNQSTGGGNKKAGFAYQVGRTSWTSVYFGNTSQRLSTLQMTLYPNVRPSRPVGSTNMGNLRYYHIPGTGNQ